MSSRIRTTVLTAAAGFWYLRLRRERARVERLAAAAFESLLNAIDSNDAETGGHVRRVAAYALILADACRLSTRERCSIERIALFHDVGKIHEALFDITHDDEKLSPADRAQIATHPQRGADVLAPLTMFYPDLGEGVLAHHERWDGAGYPRKLHGTQIPLGARVVAIADTFDAITHQRRYRRPRSLRDAVDVIVAERGNQFDPELVDVFTSAAVLRRVRRAMQRHRTVSGVDKDDNRKVVCAPEHTDVPDVAFRWRATSIEPETASPVPS